jgi:hypothetical protein
MPETPVYKNRDVPMWHDNIGFARQIRRMQVPTAYAKPNQHGSKPQFSCSVAR